MLSRTVLKTMRRLGMARRGERIVVGVSGGADSVALAELLVELAPELELSLAVAHLNHGLRAGADEDEAFCRSLAERLSLPFVAERIDVGRLAAESGRSIEDEARRARYRFLERGRELFQAQRIAVGHTLDDQAETFLLRLLRGSGARGLASVFPVVEGSRIRPLIEVRRREIEAYLESKAIAHREDPSNSDPRFTRNRIRRSTLPKLASEFNPRLVEALGRTASILRDEDDWMEAAARDAFEDVAHRLGGEVRIDVEALRLRHPALRRRLVRLAIETARDGLGLENVAHTHVEDVLSLVEPGKSGREVHLPGLVAERSFGELRIGTPRGANRGRIDGERGYNGFEYRLTIPARIRIPESGGTLSAQVTTPAWRRGPGAEHASPAVGNTVTVGIEGTLPLLKVRSPKRGDRFHPLGAPGSKPLARYLMERKVARSDRRTIPVVVRGSGVDPRGVPAEEEILWVVGHGVSEASRLSGDCQWISLKWET